MAASEQTNLAVGALVEGDLLLLHRVRRTLAGLMVAPKPGF
jgi:hypothetical protein